MKDLSDKSLQQVIDLYNQNEITKQEAAEYCLRWNITPGRFTVAYVTDGGIFQRDRRDGWEPGDRATDKVLGVRGQLLRRLPGGAWEMRTVNGPYEVNPGIAYVHPVEEKNLSK